MIGAKGTAAIHRFARLCALMAIIVYQPLAALHFATDEAHLANPATSIQVAHHAGQAHRHDGQAQGDHRQPGHPHQLCEFCLMAGVSLLSSVAPTALGWATDTPAEIFPVQPIRAEKRLNVGNPVRAPPRTV